MCGTAQRLLLAIAITVSPATAFAWAPETRVGMVDEAVRLLPASLRQALENHREEVLRGMLEPMAGEDGPEHRPPWASGRLDDRLVAAARSLQSNLTEPLSFEDVARNFGTVAHFVADANFPPGASKQDGADRYSHFSKFCESRREKFPVVFYGHKDRDLDSSDYGKFAGRIMLTASENDAQLARAYAAAGNPPDPSAFDYRSVPFAIGSLAYSQSITHIVRVWISIWQDAGGDMGRIPYWKPSESLDE
jgi:hypothetical protein